MSGDHSPPPQSRFRAVLTPAVKERTLLDHPCSFLTRVACATTAFSFLFAVVAFAANPVPTVTAPVHPQAVVPGSGALTLTVYGANFVSGAVVNWNGKPRSTTFVSARELQAKILAADVAKPTAGYITVTNPAPGGGPSSSSYTIVEVHTPTKTVVPGQPVSYQLGGDLIWFLTTGDFYNHHRLDLLAGGGTGKVYLMESKGDGTFPHTSVVGHGYFVARCNWPKSLAVGDFNNDGKLDYLFSAGVPQQTASIQMRLGNGKGQFQTSWRFGKYQGCPDFAVGDFNGDGNLDFAAVGPDFGVQIFLGNGDGTFQLGATYGNLPGAFNPAVADFNRDGKLNLLVDTTSDGLQILLGNGDGTFQNPRIIVKRRPKETGLGCGYGVSFVVDDFNSDGKIDVAYCSLAYAQIGVVLGNGDGTFQEPVYYHAGTTDCIWPFATGDFNSDGNTDFIDWYCTNPPFKSHFATLLGNGNGTLQKQTAVFLPGLIEDVGIVAGDWNSDGLLDFVMIPGASGVEVYNQK